MVEKWLHQQFIATLVLWWTCQMNQRIGYRVAGLWAKSLMFWTVLTHLIISLFQWGGIDDAASNNPPGTRHWNWWCPEHGIFASGSDVVLSLRVTPALVSSSPSATTNGCNVRIIKWGFYTMQPKSKNLYTHLFLFTDYVMRRCVSNHISVSNPHIFWSHTKPNWWITWIEDAGTVVKWNNTITTCWLVEGVLGLSPAFGGGQLQQFVMAENEIQEDTTEGVDFLVLATAGLWNVVSIRMQCQW
jgi:hypothetical protein